MVWFRRDLRLQDHPALAAAAADGARVLGVFVADDVPLTASGAPRRAFLAAALAALNESMDGRLLIAHGRPASTIPRIARAVGADAVHVSGDYGPYGRRRDAAVSEALDAAGIEWVATGSPYAISPGRVRKGDGGRFAVFTPFFRAWTHHGWRGPATSGSEVNWIRPADVDGITAHDPAEYGRTVPSAWRCPRPGRRPRRPRGRNSWPTGSTPTTTIATGRTDPAPAGCRCI